MKVNINFALFYFAPFASLREKIFHAKAQRAALQIHHKIIVD
jgi:hypothetical protein